MKEMRLAVVLITAFVMSVLVFLYSLFEIVTYLFMHGYLTETATFIGVYLLGVLTPVVIYLKLIATATRDVNHCVLNTSMSKMLEMLG